MDSQFRNAAFGGFNRQDVMEYLERTSKEHNEALAQLRSQLEQVQQEMSEQNAKQELLQGQVQRLTEARDAAVQETEQEKSARLDAEQQVQEREARLARLENELRILRGTVEQLKPDAEAYAAVKERTAGVELEAHRRAQKIVDEAREEAARMHRQMEQWLGRFGREYEELCGQVDATVAHAAGELDKVRMSLDRISQCVGHQEEALVGMARVMEQDPAKVPAPLPLD